MKKFGIQLVFLIILIFVASQFAFNREGSTNLFGSSNNLNYLLKINQKVMNVELADTPAKRQQGLSNRESIATDSGMLFLFDTQEKHRFWMKGMKIPLDLVWIKDQRVVEINTHVPPPEPGTSDDQLQVYESFNPIDQVLEVNSGFTDSNNIKVGDTVELMQQ